MDEVSLDKLVAEVFEAAEWFGISPDNANGEMFGLGAVAAKYRLLGNTEAVEQLAAAVDHQIGQSVYAEQLQRMVEFSIGPNSHN